MSRSSRKTKSNASDDDGLSDHTSATRTTPGGPDSNRDSQGSKGFHGVTPLESPSEMTSDAGLTLRDISFD